MLAACFATTALLCFLSLPLQAQRARPSAWTPPRASAVHGAPALALDSLRPRPSGPSHLGRWVLLGASLGAIGGYAYYQRNLGADEDFAPYLSIPITVGGGAAIGTFFGWLIPTLLGPSPPPREAAAVRAHR